jgi:hypothetical protein
MELIDGFATESSVQQGLSELVPRQRIQCEGFPRLQEPVVLLQPDAQPLADEIAHGVGEEPDELPRLYLSPLAGRLRQRCPKKRRPSSALS